MDTEPGDIHARMALVMAEIGAVGKTQRNKEQNYEFRGIDDVFDAVHPAMVKAKVTLSYVVEDMQSTDITSARGAKGRLVVLRVRYIFTAPDGTAVSTVTYGECAAYDDKAINKALQAALKYALIQMFLIPLGEPEADHSDPEETVEPTVEPAVEWATKEEVDYLIELSRALTEEQKREAASIRQALGITDFKTLPEKQALHKLVQFVELLIEDADGPTYVSVSNEETYDDPT